MKKQLLLPALVCSFLTLPFWGGDGGAAHAQAPGSLDLSFDPGLVANYGVYRSTLQPDGKILVTLGDEQIIRLNADGTLDGSFSLPPEMTDDLGNGAWYGTVAMQSNGKILIAQTRIYGGCVNQAVHCPRLVRLNTDGSFDGSFIGDPESIAMQPCGNCSSGYRFAIQSDDKIVIISGLSTVERLNADGSLDDSFNTGAVSNLPASTIAIQPDGKIIIAGGAVVRLNADGSLDSSFSVGTNLDLQIRTIALQPDGKIIIGGSFTAINGTAINNIARLNADGSLDASFTTGTGANQVVFTTAIQPDGKIVIGGRFNIYNGTAVNYIARLNANGTLDNSFTSGMGSGVGGSSPRIYSTAIQPDGKIIIGGEFESYDGTGRVNIARLNGGGSTNVNDMETEGFSVFPNPSNGLFTVVLDGMEGIVQLNVMDIRGREVASQSLTARGRTTHNIDLSGFANGVYTLRIQSAAGVSGVKLVKE